MDQEQELNSHPDVQMFYRLRDKMSDPEESLTETERSMYPEVRARAYMVRDKIFNNGYQCVTEKSEEERLEAIQEILYIHPVWVKNHVQHLLKKHLHSLVESYLKGKKQGTLSLKEEEEKFMNSPKIKEFYRSVEEKKKRCDELMKYDTDFELYKALTDTEISDFI